MDFNKLMQTMRELDQPVGEAKVQECGMDSPMMGGMPPVAPQMGSMTQPPPAHPSMSLNLNAQGLDNIESLMKLMTRVNPDMINQKAPLNAMPHAAEIDSDDDGMGMLTPPGPSISGIGDLGDLDKGPLKMLPDLDSDNDDMPGGEMDIDIDMGDEGPGDTDDEGPNDGAEGPDHEAGETPEFEKGEEEEEGEEEKEEAYANEPDEEYKSVDYMNNQLAGGMNRPKKTFPKVAGGDNPMQRNESGDLRAQIRAELLQRLSEAKGAK